MALLAISHILSLILILSANVCLQTNPSHETIVSTPTSLPLDISLGNNLNTNCDKKLISSKKEILIISTLDGKLSALDVESGQQIWSKVFTSEPLLSSTISNFEITRKGRVVRVVPSLDGNLYLFNGKTIDGIPLNADILLKSSFKLGDDLVITGGQESQVSGIEISSGKVYYECGIKGCPSSQLNENETFDDLFLLKRITQTVRAIDPRSGRQKWYFSVTEPQISETSFSECPESDEIDSEKNQSLKETDFNIIVPNGFISVKRQFTEDNKESQTSQWSHRFESPIVHVWHYRSGRINSIDLFDKRKLFGITNTDRLDLNGFEPTVYIGLYRHQWYVQSSSAIKNQMLEKNKDSNHLLVSKTTKQIDSKSNVLQIEWKPKAIHFEDSKNSLELESSPKFSLSISSENEENVGYYIFDVIDDNETKCFGSKEDQYDWEFDEYEEESDLIQQIVIASLWHYWKEVTTISVISAFVLNFVYSFVKRKFRDNCEKSNNEEIPNNSNSKSSGSPSTPSFSQTFESTNGSENNCFNSRYESDFKPIQLLGRGGFGLVFEAKHIIDESHYAVKRISLPIRREQREKVMREVRALSKLEHSGIVRYYNAWVELPPPGWQENKDKQWDTEDISKTNLNESLLSGKGMASNLLSSNKYNDILSENDFSCDSLKIMRTQTQSQSLDIVFDENISSIKLIETNRVEKTTTTTTQHSTSLHKNFTSNQKNNFIENSERPKNLISGGISRCYLYIQMQLCRKETLKDWLFANSLNRDSIIVLDIFDQIVSAVHYVHSMGLMHRDLKPTNIFFSMDGNIKIGDFGLVTATSVDDDIHTPADNQSEDTISSILNQSSSSHTNRVGTQLYMSPEQIQNHQYSHKVDIFSMGIIFFELLIPFKTEMERNQLLISARKQKFPEDFCKKFSAEFDLLKRLLDHNPEKRPTTVEIKEHEVLKKIQSNTPIVRQRSRTLSFTNDERK